MRGQGSLTKWSRSAVAVAIVALIPQREEYASQVKSSQNKSSQVGQVGASA